MYISFICPGGQWMDQNPRVKIGDTIEVQLHTEPIWITSITIDNKWHSILSEEFKKEKYNNLKIMKKIIPDLCFYCFKGINKGIISKNELVTTILWDFGVPVYERKITCAYNETDPVINTMFYGSLYGDIARSYEFTKNVTIGKIIRIKEISARINLKKEEITFDTEPLRIITIKVGSGNPVNKVSIMGKRTPIPIFNSSSKS